MQATAQQLKTIFIFSSLPPTLLDELSHYSEIEVFSRGAVVIHEGDRFPQKLHAVLEGQLLVQKLSPAGKETILRQLPGGEMFAAPALFGDGIAPATVIAMEDSQVVTVEKKILLETIRSTPELAFQILNCFNQRLQEMHQTIHGLVSERAIVRLCRMIDYTANRYGVESLSEGDRLNAQLPYQQMARMIGITYEECVRIVKKDLHAIIQYGRGGVITILDVAALQAQLTNY